MELSFSEFAAKVYELSPGEIKNPVKEGYWTRWEPVKSASEMTSPSAGATFSNEPMEEPFNMSLFAILPRSIPIQIIPKSDPCILPRTSNKLL